MEHCHQVGASRIITTSATSKRSSDAGPAATKSLLMTSRHEKWGSCHRPPINIVFQFLAQNDLPQ
eukprot:m.1155432 g.1155432  ORF g.1155432 m.1155432 type:complete len:65 (-) comp24489_c1_seq36:1172-1366(-)